MEANQDKTAETQFSAPSLKGVDKGDTPYIEEETQFSSPSLNEVDKEGTPYIEPKKKNIRGKHNNHKTNDAYIGLTDEAKRKAITRNYYDKKGKLIYAIKNRVSKYGMDKDLFNECKTIDEVNVKVGEYLLTKGFTEENVRRMINRPTNYNK